MAGDVGENREEELGTFVTPEGQIVRPLEEVFEVDDRDDEDSEDSDVEEDEDDRSGIL
jgi:hypothetical protein